jgi:glycosyltransferase involved in cell wall biosynthesis
VERHTMKKRVALSVVIPVYNSAKIFPELYSRIVHVLTKVVQTFEIIPVVDGCTDNSAEVIGNLCKQDSRLKLVELSRNFGHQAAITAGLRFSSGEMVMIMDDDLEDPPEIIPQFIRKAKEGFDVVYGIRKKRKVPLVRRFSYYLFYRLLNRLTPMQMPHDAGDFCLMRRPVVKALNSMQETNRYVRGMRTWLGFHQTGIEYERGLRSRGKSGYNLTKYVKLALNAILSFSYKPLEVVSVMGFIIALASFILAVRTIIIKLMGKIEHVPGWASLMVVLLFLGGIQLMSIGILGQYIARIYDETKKRPKFVVKQFIGIDREDVDA